MGASTDIGCVEMRGGEPDLPLAGVGASSLFKDTGLQTSLMVPLPLPHATPPHGLSCTKQNILAVATALPSTRLSFSYGNNWGRRSGELRL